MAPAPGSGLRATGRRRRTFLVECFAPVGADDPRLVADRLRAACLELRDGRLDVDYLGALAVPQDELVLHLLVAADAAVAKAVAEHASLVVERVVESLAFGPHPRAAIVVPGLTNGTPPRSRAPSRSTGRRR